MKVTRFYLDLIAKQINKATGNFGYCFIESGNGGYRLMRTISNKTSDVLSTGFISKKELAPLMHDFLLGIEKYREKRSMKSNAD